MPDPRPAAGGRTLRVVLPEAPHSGLVVLVPEAEPLVGQLRERLDPNAAVGVAAHVTVLFPFMAPELIDDAVLARLGAVFAGVPSFPYAFERTAWFDQLVLWLAPADDRPFRLLTRLVHEAFPDYPPFQGAFADPIPHLTVGHEAPLESLRAAETELADLTPIRGHASMVTLLEQPVPGQPVSVREVFALR